MLSSFHPDLVLYDAGVDPHACDSLGYLKMTDIGKDFSNSIPFILYEHKML